MTGKPLFSPGKSNKTLEESGILHHDTAVFFDGLADSVDFEKYGTAMGTLHILLSYRQRLWLPATLDGIIFLSVHAPIFRKPAAPIA